MQSMNSKRIYAPSLFEVEAYEVSSDDEIDETDETCSDEEETEEDTDEDQRKTKKARKNVCKCSQIRELLDGCVNYFQRAKVFKEMLKKWGLNEIDMFRIEQGECACQDVY